MRSTAAREADEKGRREHNAYRYDCSTSDWPDKEAYICSAADRSCRLDGVVAFGEAKRSSL